MKNSGNSNSWDNQQKNKELNRESNIQGGKETYLYRYLQIEDGVKSQWSIKVGSLRLCPQLTAREMEQHQPGHFRIGGAAVDRICWGWFEHGG